MEIFQTIWTALTTENEFLTKILFIPETFIETLVGMLLFSAILNITATKNNKIKYIICFSIVANITSFIIPNPYRSFINLLTMFFSIKLFFKTNIFKTLLAVIFPLVVTVLCESIFMKICISYFNFDANSIVLIPLYRLLISLCIQLLVFLVYKLIKYLKFNILVFEHMSYKNKSRTVYMFCKKTIPGG